MASQITGVSVVQAQIKESIKASRYWTLRGIHRWPDGFPSQRASKAENVSIWWCHNGFWAVFGHNIQFSWNLIDIPHVISFEFMLALLTSCNTIWQLNFPCITITSHIEIAVCIGLDVSKILVSLLSKFHIFPNSLHTIQNKISPKRTCLTGHLLRTMRYVEP